MSDEEPDKGTEEQQEPDMGEQGPDWQAEAEKWKALARKHEGASKTNAEAAKELAKIREADKTEGQLAAERALEAEKRAVAAETTSLQLEVALDKAPEGMSVAQIRKLAKRLTGNTREDFEADAEELFADFAPVESEREADTPRRPRERLRPGAVPPVEPEEMDPKKLAAQVPRGW